MSDAEDTFELICDCGCEKPLEQAKKEARMNSGWLSPDQAEASVTGILRKVKSDE